VDHGTKETKKNLKEFQEKLIKMVETRTKVPVLADSLV
jgi:hypothetical protein